jgi:hypothetical protein
MFELAAEQLDRWRSWGIINENQIARMLEVELTSEFAQLMLSGITGRNQAAITALYENKDQDFPERNEIERRFRAVMDSIDDVLGEELSTTSFNKRSPFYGLFATIYDATFGIDSVLKRKKPSRLPGGIRDSLRIASKAIENKTAPVSVLNALARRTTHPVSRKVVVKYLKRKCGIG